MFQAFDGRLYVRTLKVAILQILSIKENNLPIRDLALCLFHGRRTLF